MNRRNFMRTAAGVGSAAVLGLGLKGEGTEAAEKKPGSPVTRVLGRTGLRVPVVSMGVMNADNPELLRQSYKLGIRHFDTAWFYQRGNNEKMVGRVMKELGAKREDYVIATKIFLFEDPKKIPVGKEAKDLFLKRFDQSLARLQMDYVDILYYHAIDRVSQVLDPAIQEAMSELRQKGKIRFTGISTHGNWPELLRVAADKGFYDVALLSYNYSMQGDARYIEAARYAKDKGMGLVAMKTQCQQAWYRDMLPDEMKKFYEGEVMHSALLKWVMRHEEFATSVPGFTTFQQMEEDFAVATNLEFSKHERGFLEDKHVKLALLSNCRLCGDCAGSCPKGVDLQNLMRTHMYAYSYGNALKARDTLATIDPARGLEACASCEVCGATCVRSVNIASRIGELQQLYA